jgi:hypothetical protein
MGRYKGTKNWIGLKFNNLIILNFSHKDKYLKSHYLCKCKCGDEKTYLLTAVVNGYIKSCGCSRVSEYKSKKKYKSGDKVNILTILCVDHIDRYGHRHYLCKCDCGKEKIISDTVIRRDNGCGCGYERHAMKRRLPYGQTAKNRVMATYHHDAKKDNREFNLSLEQMEEIMQAPCFYCGAVKTNIRKSRHNNGDYEYNGIDRFDNNKGYVIDNVVTCCKQCNLSKNNKTISEFLEWLKKIYSHLQEKGMIIESNKNME